MISEVLCALVGITGSLIVEDRISGDLHISDAASMLTTASERAQMNKVLSLGTSFKKLKSFVNTHELSWITMANKGSDVSAYVAVLCSGFEEIMHAYLADITLLDKIARQEILAMSYVVQVTQKVSVVGCVRLSSN
jgi:hypothetical protein